VLGLYVFANDSATINNDIVVRFLRALKAAQDAGQAPGSSSSSTTLDIEPFIPLAADLLGYFRTAFSGALLPLLRLFAASGGTQLPLTAVSPDLLQQEVARLLTNSSLNAYYRAAASGCGTRPVPGAAAGPSLLAGGGVQVGTRGRELQHERCSYIQACERLTVHFSVCCSPDGIIAGVQVVIALLVKSARL
jgi:hypothetical protein